MIFHCHQRIMTGNDIPRLMINNTLIEQVTEFNFLGLTVNEYMNWNSYTQNIVNKISRTLGVMNRLKRSWWRHQMETYSALLAICVGHAPVSGEFPTQRPVTRSFDVFFDLRLNKRLSKQSCGWSFETLSCPLWRQCNDTCPFQQRNWCMIRWSFRTFNSELQAGALNGIAYQNCKNVPFRSWQIAGIMHTQQLHLWK